VLSGNRQGEAFTEVQPGGVLSSENILLWWPTLSCQEEGNSNVERQWRVRYCPHGVPDHSHGWKPSARKPRDPGDIHSFHGWGSVGEGKSHHADMHVVGESDRPIVPEKSMGGKGGKGCSSKRETVERIELRPLVFLWPGTLMEERVFVNGNLPMNCLPVHGPSGCRARRGG